jgi:2-amino-4-hydroxy-6-hydroxymethyldihydropteridine diphosphokinase
MEQIAYIALGSNLGDRQVNLDKAVMLLDTVDGVQVRRLSHLVETLPLSGGPADQGEYLNGVVEIQTTLSPLELLAALQQIEKSLGRDRTSEPRWGARTCDLDILLIGQTVMDCPELTIPHPRMHQRRFVLEPLSELSPQVSHPVLGKTAGQLLAELPKEESPKGILPKRILPR